MQYRGRAALQRRVKGERVEQAFQACMKEVPRRAGFSRRSTSTANVGTSRPSTGPGSSLRYKVPEGTNESSPPVHWRERATPNTNRVPAGRPSAPHHFSAAIRSANRRRLPRG
jgi:hypothetical protein